MDKEKLKKLGVADELIEKVLSLHNESLDGKFIPKHRFDEINEQLKTSQKTLGERDSQIEELNKFKGTQEELQAKIKELEEENKTKTETLQTELSNVKKKNAIKLAILENKEYRPHDIDMVMSLLDFEKIEVDEKGLSGLKEQQENLVKEKSFLFEKKDESQNKWKPIGNKPADKGQESEHDEGLSYGKQLAKTKIKMLGLKQE